jgi:hypothetical protein
VCEEIRKGKLFKGQEAAKFGPVPVLVKGTIEIYG